MKKTILITGATAGIGKATALLFAKNGYQTIITGRRKDRLELLKKELGKDCIALNFDVRNRDEIQNAISQLPESHKVINILCNNAGLARGKKPITEEEDFTKWDTMIDTNLKGLIYTTEAVLPFIPRDGSGQIINISSIAGLQSYPGGYAYCASKHGVEGFSNGLRIDLLKEKIRVANINPGLVNTEFSMVRFGVEKAEADKVYEGMQPLVAQDIAECVYWTANRPKHVNINQMVVMPSAQADAHYLERD